MFEASYYQSDKKNCQCLLCPHKCYIKPDKLGLCGVRKNINGKVFSLVWGKLSAINTDPIEKKPLYHFYPGSKILSLGSYGCNLSCLYCQNYSIARENIPQNINRTSIIGPEEVLAYLSNDHIGMAYTYNEPTVWIEYVKECAALVKEKGKKNVFISNGYMTHEALVDLIPLIDAFSIDLKGFSEDFYRSICQGSLAPVLQNLITIRDSSSHLEVDFLVIPEFNDNPEHFKDMLDWYINNLGISVPLHINRYFPHYKMNKPATSMETIKRLYSMAKERLRFVHAGNITVQEDRTL